MPAAIRVSVNSGLNETQVPRADSFTKTGYISDGKWYTLWGSQYNEFIFGENGTPLTDNTTLHLQWREAEVTITNTDFTFNNGKYNETYSGAVITASVESGAGGAILYSIAEGSLPDGLTLDTFTGEINGTAARAGYFIFTIRATNEASGAFAEKMFSINAAKAEYDMSGITFSDMAISYNGAAHSIFINGNLPEGLTAQYDGNGQTAEGTHTVTVRFTAADSVNYIVPQSMSALLIIAKTSSIDRVILPAEQGGKTPEILSVNVIPDGFSIGPNPVNKQADIVSFFRQGRGIENGTLYVYGSDGNLVRKIRINDKSCSGQQKRKVGEWDLTDSKGRHVSEGSYLIRGTIKTKNGNKEKISLVLGVR
ncbi:MAG: putative Ig domain-containing protein [Chitinispirillales bacterium]|nr:putative Ig domain-containing protein [Chitinispirillales bacterium]